ncbi:hypothetical protein [Bifidobacterium tibiigranuli]|jgi:hypothetical protein|uniref:hypothetical protein n=1 Tax=Bifidobacterium tibiigranuli TaxID=2172043 RepID=UPI0026F10B08|nr:hypothetical protein [Bifidobacterium tibiigranuli]MCI1712633.1 hypothetical protein [Bifidobacterium tibiigranuli]MCI1833806.1 hypothetical protein [Bifidobacterium tibiigranuli]
MPDDDPMASLNRYLTAIGFRIVMALVVLAIIWSIISIIKVRNDGYRQQGQLNAAYVNCQNYYDSMIGAIQSMHKVTQEDADKLVEAYLRYNASKYQGMQASLLVDSIPQLGNLDYAQLNNAIGNYSREFRSTQEQMLKALGNFESWKEGTLTARLFAGGFPTSALVARFGTNREYGSAALEKMYTIATFGETQAAYATNTRKPLI